MGRENRRHNFQTISWFWDLYKRQLLQLDPPYQRRSVWNQNFKDYFVDTVLLEYPAPAIFLFEEISVDGTAKYNVVDGKQRLTTLFEFVEGNFPVFEQSEKADLRGLFFEGLPDEIKKEFWAYQFTVEYLPEADEKVLNSIFDRINRNVAKLTSQELRHAKLDGLFISTAERLAEWISLKLPRNFPHFNPQSRKQMKDVEFVAILLLFLEEGPKTYSQTELDEAFVQRDEIWEERENIEEQFRATIGKIEELLRVENGEHDLASSRLKNQADFYSLFGAFSELLRESNAPDTSFCATRISEFLSLVSNETSRRTNEDAYKYYGAARSASSDRGPRETRIQIMKRVISGS
jgi:hypothetical protein